MSTKTNKALRIAAASALLAAILACGGNNDDTPPRPTTTANPTPTTPTPTTPTPPPTVGTQLTTLSTGFLPDPQTSRGTAGGALQASTLGGATCRGYVSAAPQHTLMAQTAFTNLRVIVNSTQDTTLMIRGPDGVYRCADDDEGTNPIVTGAFPAGAYQIWIGSYAAGQNPAYVVGFTELSSVTAASLGT